jgi:hypothetical protein
VLLGVFQFNPKGGLVVPFDASDGVPLPVPASARHGAQEGDAVVVAVIRGGRGGVAEAKVTEVLGPVEAPGVDVQVVARRHSLRREFPEEVRVAAAKIVRAIAPKDLAARERFEDPPISELRERLPRRAGNCVREQEIPAVGVVVDGSGLVGERFHRPNLVEPVVAAPPRHAVDRHTHV